MCSLSSYPGIAGQRGRRGTLDIWQILSRLCSKPSVTKRTAISARRSFRMARGPVSRHGSCRVGRSSPLLVPEFLALGVQPPDAGVDLGSLVFVDPPGWYPFR
jgi:hypothetical protein